MFYFLPIRKIWFQTKVSNKKSLKRKIKSVAVMLHLHLLPPGSVLGSAQRIRSIARGGSQRAQQLPSAAEVVGLPVQPSAVPAEIASLQSFSHLETLLADESLSDWCGLSVYWLFCWFNLFIYLFIYLSIYLSIYLFILCLSWGESIKHNGRS